MIQSQSVIKSGQIHIVTRPKCICRVK